MTIQNLPSTNSFLSRRGLVKSVTLAAGALAFPGRTDATSRNGVEAIAFDAFPIFDARSISTAARAHFPDKGSALALMWANKLFGYTWLLTAAGQYRPFSEVAEAALRFAAGELGLTLSSDIALALLDSYSRLDVWPDVKPALKRLGAAGIRLAFLSNLDEPTLYANMQRSGIETYFDYVLSTDRVQCFKPAPAAYGMARDAFRLPTGRIGFAAFGGWDAVGAGWFGYRTAWINRSGAAADTLEPAPGFVSESMSGVLSLAGIG